MFGSICLLFWSKIIALRIAVLCGTKCALKRVVYFFVTPWRKLCSRVFYLINVNYALFAVGTFVSYFLLFYNQFIWFQKVFAAIEEKGFVLYKDRSRKSCWIYTIRFANVKLNNKLHYTSHQPNSVTSSCHETTSGKNPHEQRCYFFVCLMAYSTSHELV